MQVISGMSERARRGSVLITCTSIVTANITFLRLCEAFIGRFEAEPGQRVGKMKLFLLIPFLPVSFVYVEEGVAHSFLCLTRERKVKDP